MEKLEALQQGQLILAGWKKHLETYPDNVYKQAIFDIIRYGAKLGYTGPEQFILSPNLLSAKEAPDILTKDVEEQRDKGRLTRVDILPSKFISSPLGLVPNKMVHGAVSIIYLILKDRRYINDFIPQEWALEYPTFKCCVDGNYPYSMVAANENCFSISARISHAVSFFNFAEFSISVR